MKITIAGYNVEREQLEQLRPYDPAGSLTPEVLSASYARISRDPRPIEEIRGDARQQVEKARKSNEQIVFDMGHSSIAEHAVFNIDIVGVSRLVVEEIERTRLASYTEKSQRYITLADDDYLIPSEIRDAGAAATFCALIKKQNAAYDAWYTALLPYVAEKFKHTVFDKKSVLEGLAKEDARYIVALTTKAQLGMTINARTLEHLLVRLFSSKLAESRACAEQLYAQVKAVTPSLIRYVQPTAYVLKRNDEIAAYAHVAAATDTEHRDVQLLSVTPDADDVIIASLFYAHTSADTSFADCRARVSGMTPDNKRQFMLSLFRDCEAYDTVPREFEMVEYVFELEMSAACFGQLKRHRMATLLTQPYTPVLGVTIPESIRAIGQEPLFTAIIAETNSLYEKFQALGPAAAYVLTNAHKRRVLMKVTARELYHFSRMREDQHAQWDIRALAGHMVAEARKETPLTMLLCCGKSNFKDMKARLLQK